MSLGITADDLICVLEQVPDDVLMFKNTVGNLAMFRDGEYVGFIDLATAELLWLNRQLLQ